MMLFSHVCNPIYMTEAEKLFSFLIQELVAWYPCILVVPNEGALSNKAKALGVEVAIVPCPLIYSLYHAHSNVRAELAKMQSQPVWDQLRNLIHTHRPDYVMVNTIEHLLPIACAKSLGIPTIWKITETMLKHEWNPQSIALVNQYADHIIGTSNVAMKPFIAAGLADKMTVFTPSWRIEELEPGLWSKNRELKRKLLKLDDSKKLIGYVSSSISRNTGFYHFVKMALTLCDWHRHVEFIMVGKPTDEAYFQKCLARIQSSRHYYRFHFISFEYHMQAVYPAMDMVVVPSLAQEGFEMTALMGMVFGKAVVTYNAGDLGELMQATGNAEHAVELGDVSGLTARISDLLYHAELANEVGEHNRIRVADAFGIEAYRRQLGEFMACISKLKKKPTVFVPQVSLTIPSAVVREGTGTRRRKGSGKESVRWSGKESRKGIGKGSGKRSGGKGPGKGSGKRRCLLRGRRRGLLRSTVRRRRRRRSRTLH